MTTNGLMWSLLNVWLLHIVATITPGANTLLVAQLAASGRGPMAWFAALGVAVGSALWATLAAMGVNLVFSAFPVLRISLQVVGALYLLYVAMQLWNSAGRGPVIAVRSASPWAAFRLGVLTNFTNPKAALFFGGVFSACFPPHPSPALWGAAVAVVFVNAMGWYGLLAHGFSREAVRSAYLRNRQLVGKAAGALLGTMGLRLLWSLREAKP